MLGRADIEGSKSNVALNAWLPRRILPLRRSSVSNSISMLGRAELTLNASMLQCNVIDMVR